MEWINVEDTKKEIPWSKVCVYDGGNTFWAYLQEIKITPNKRELKWNVIKPDGIGVSEPLYWMKIEPPKE